MVTTRKRSSGQRDTVKAKNATIYAKRTARGRFKEMDESHDEDEVRLRRPW